MRIWMKASVTLGLSVLILTFSCGDKGPEPDPDPQCSVSPTSLNFGTVDVGDSENLYFTITNTGGRTLSGSVTGSCSHYSIQSGGGPYNLGANQSKTITIRFEPTSEGTHACIIQTGSLCANVNCTGEGLDPDPICSVSPASLDFGSVNIDDQHVNRIFTITNIGGGTLTGSVTEGCNHFSIYSGGGTYTLGAGQSKTVTIRFDPSETGHHNCTIQTGSSCDNVYCSGEGISGGGDPICSVSPASLDFGTVDIGDYADLSFTIRNSGGGTLSGTVTESCDHYSIQSGGGDYNLEEDESKIITIRFQPTLDETLTCIIQTDSLCANVSCTGVGVGDPPICSISPTNLDFGNVNINDQRVYRSFTITNIGGGTLTDSVTESCNHYSIYSGGGEYNLDEDQSKTVTIRFDPSEIGTHNCPIQTGSLCDNVNCTGRGVDDEDPPICSVSPTTLNFGSVNINGQHVDRTFTITNIGGGTLTGSVTESCNHYSIYSGGGDYSLGADQYKTVTIRFDPSQTGTHTCTIQTGSSCNNVFCTGVGVDDPPICSVSPTSLNFGNVNIDSYADRSFTITNTGGGTLSGNVSESCPHYSFVSGGGPYNLNADQSQDVITRFSPNVSGTLTCTIETGNSICSDVSCTGVSLDSVYLDFTFITGGFFTRSGNYPNINDIRMSASRVDWDDPTWSNCSTPNNRVHAVLNPWLSFDSWLEIYKEGFNGIWVYSSTDYVTFTYTADYKQQGDRLTFMFGESCESYYSGNAYCTNYTHYFNPSSCGSGNYYHVELHVDDSSDEVAVSQLHIYFEGWYANYDPIRGHGEIMIINEEEEDGKE